MIVSNSTFLSQCLRVSISGGVERFVLMVIVVERGDTTDACSLCNLCNLRLMFYHL